MSDPSPVDVSRLVSQLREQIALRRAAGNLTAEDIEWLIGERLTLSIAKARIDQGLAERLLRESHDWNTDTGYQIRTRRRGLAAAVIRAGKALVRPFVRLYTDHILNRQSQLNLAIWHVLLDLVERSVALEIEIRKLQKQLKDLQDRGRP